MDGKSKLFKYGGEGCIFIPELPCNSQKKTKKRKKKDNKRKKSTKRKTKLLFVEIPSNEIKISKIIKKSKNYHDWCLLWDSTCISKDYNSLKKFQMWKNVLLKQKNQYQKEIKNLNYYKVIL